MSYNENIPKWIYASLAKHFSSVATAVGLKYYPEGLEDPNSEVYQNSNLSLRVDGPWAVEGSSLTDHRVEVQAFLTIIGDQNFYTVFDHAGTVAQSLRGVIPVYTIPENPALQVGCLDIDRSTEESVRIVNFNRVSTSSNVRQIAVVARLLYESSDV